MAAATASVCRGAEMWMPETGEVRLEDLPRDAPEARRRHALALIGAGQVSGGIAELRELLAAEPDAPWADEARLAIGRGLLAAGHATKAFDELAALLKASPDGPSAAQARAVQQTAAQVLARTDPDAAAELYSRLIDTAADEEEAARLQRDIGDSYFQAGRYLDAEAEYLALITLYPRSELCAYAWYQSAECEWGLARRMGLGLERMESAERRFRDFADTYPTDERAEQARKRAAEVRETRAALNWEIARFYVDAEKKPWAAVGYLERVVREFPDTPQAGWASEELAAVRQGLEAPLRGTVRRLPLPGVRSAADASVPQEDELQQP